MREFWFGPVGMLIGHLMMAVITAIIVALLPPMMTAVLVLLSMTFRSVCIYVGKVRQSNAE